MNEILFERCFICGWIGCSKKHNTTDEKTIKFITRARNVHSYRYDYSNVIYNNAKTKIKIICSIHDVFEQIPDNHTRKKYGCNICARNKKIIQSRFIQKSKKIHKDKYDYSLVEYINVFTKVKIICKEHGIFEQTPRNHVNCCRGCQKCICILYGGIKLSTDEFISRSIAIHNNKYDYSLVNYVNITTKVKIICKDHGVFEQRPVNHTNLKRGCPYCAKTKKLTVDKFIVNAKKIHNNDYDYSLVQYINIDTKVKIICKNHGIFEQTPDNHTSGKQGCPVCQESHGEKAIRLYAEKNKLDYNREYKILNFKFRYDFCIKINNNKILIEYDGLQHFKENTLFSRSNQKEIDIVKTKLAVENNYFIVRIPYTELNQIDKILDDIVKNPRSLVVFSKNNENINKIYKIHSLCLK